MIVMFQMEFPESPDQIPVPILAEAGRDRLFSQAYKIIKGKIHARGNSCAIFSYNRQGEPPLSTEERLSYQPASGSIKRIFASCTAL